jgi:hypothetical protein
MDPKYILAMAKMGKDNKIWLPKIVVDSLKLKFKENIIFYKNEQGEILLKNSKEIN